MGKIFPNNSIPISKIKINLKEELDDNNKLEENKKKFIKKNLII